MRGAWFGDRSRFAMHVGKVDPENEASRVVEVYAADCWLTRVTNQVYVPHFAGVVANSLRNLIDRDLHLLNVTFPHAGLSAADNYRRLKAEAATDNTEYLSYRFMDWGPTVDNVSMLLFRNDKTATLTFSFVWPDNVESTEQGQVFVAEMPLMELAAVLHDVAWRLMWDWADRSKWR